MGRRMLGGGRGLMAASDGGGVLAGFLPSESFKHVTATAAQKPSEVLRDAAARKGRSQEGDAGRMLIARRRRRRNPAAVFGPGKVVKKRINKEIKINKAANERI